MTLDVQDMISEDALQVTNQKPIAMELDAIDHQILAELAEDGRRSVARIATAVGLSDTTVKNRIERLTSSGACRIMAVVNPMRLGYDTVIFIAVKVETGMAENVGNAILDFVEVHWMEYTSGRFDLLAELTLRDATDVFDVVSRRVSALAGITSVETFLATRQTWFRPNEWRPALDGEAFAQNRHRRAPRWRGDGSCPSDDPRAARAPVVRLDDIDRGILAQLQEDGRRPAIEIAAAVGVGRSTVKNRIDRLLSQGVCRVYGVLDPNMLGYTKHALVGLTVDPAANVAAGEALAGMPEIFWLSHLTGRYDIAAEVILQEPADFLDFSKRRISSIPGVRTVETSLMTSNNGWRAASWWPFAAPITDTDR